MKKTVRTPKNAPPIGPYSQGVVANGFVFAAGQAGVDPKTGQLVLGGIAAQTRQTLENIRNILEAAGCGLEDVVSSTVYLVNMADFAAMNEVYGEFFPQDPPARTTVGVASLPMGAAVEITCIAVLKG
ncbi:MAG: Rid family detoxifying hydrolase [Thermomonas hydrothermalis]|uniref:RidA family protein n=1 Tax=Thermomonas hydrothermalis TaxID=213588 RepID=UPI002353B29C|nr:Rid family detoxifying hydrolase [Thermomonas hydrothermalis]MCL6619886.1 Rid family detoxifying hydrolase [Thermomonas hydrothermalis]